MLSDTTSAAPARESLAAMVDAINDSRAVHVLTIEDPRWIGRHGV